MFNFTNQIIHNLSHEEPLKFIDGPHIMNFARDLRLRFGMETSVLFDLGYALGKGFSDSGSFYNQGIKEPEEDLSSFKKLWCIAAKFILRDWTECVNLDIPTLKASLTYCAMTDEARHATGYAFYSTFLKRHPQYLPWFENVDMDRQILHFKMALLLVADVLNTGKIEEFLPVGISHGAMAVPPEAYDNFFTVLVELILGSHPKESLTFEAGEKIRIAWIKLGAVVKAILLRPSTFKFELLKGKFDL